ncbi:MAG: discoidin domain-containing protein [Puniceicoccales bacterium]|jgi:hypothetical protein|nr:discoidin domain-containing protein [Puniceicoccales bacterium]
MKKHILTTALLAAFAAATPAIAQEKLKLAFPPVNIVGTPIPINIPHNKDESGSYLAPEISVPSGVKNLAKNKKVTSSDPNPIVGELSLITDGDKDADEGFEVELAPGSQWVQIDLEKSATIYAVAVWHFHRQKRSYKAVTIQISDDPTFKTGVKTIFNTDTANINKQGVGTDQGYVETNFGRLIEAKGGIQGRYVRLYSAGSNATTGNHYIEVEVHGI